MMSHMLDCQLYGLNPGGHHLTNVLLHTATVILLFLVLRRMTGFLWRSAFVAAVFAIHPLRVESVAWVAERKDVLSGLFFMLTLWAYTRYAQVTGQGRSDTNGLRSVTRHVTLSLRLLSGAVVFCAGPDVQADAGDAAVGAAAAGLLAAGTVVRCQVSGARLTSRETLNPQLSTLNLASGKAALARTGRRIVCGHDFCPEEAHPVVRANFPCLCAWAMP